jgi:hypothetical protein
MAEVIKGGGAVEKVEVGSWRCFGYLVTPKPPHLIRLSYLEYSIARYPSADQIRGLVYCFVNFEISPYLEEWHCLYLAEPLPTLDVSESHCAS